ncbi:MAG: hypothetical protein ACI9ND_002111, partial [Yoonia sp.]
SNADCHSLLGHLKVNRSLRREQICRSEPDCSSELALS